jgi:DNA-binding NarL/FixJ family response regulator
VTRILIADDHEVVRTGLRAVLETHEGWEVVAEAENGKDAVAKALGSQPDVAIIDYSLPLINGVEATRQIRARLPNTQILIFTMFDNEMLVRDLLEAGARAYVVKSEANQYLIAAVESLVNHKPFFVGRVSEELLKSYLTTRVHRDGSTLTPRERLVIYLVSEGHTNKEIGTILNLSAKTIETHWATAMHKLNLASTAAIVRYAVRNKMVEP